MMKQLNRTLWVLLAVAVLVLPMAACEREEGPMEEMGETLDDAVDDAQDKVEDMGDELEDAGDEAEDALEDAGDELEDAVEGDGAG